MKEGALFWRFEYFDIIEEEGAEAEKANQQNNKYQCSRGARNDKGFL
jgi:hypothetical protein